MKKEKKTRHVTIRITESEYEFIKTNKLSITELFNKALKLAKRKVKK